MTTMDGRWTAHRTRAHVLAERYSYAAELLGLYVALLDVWEEAADLVRADRPRSADLPQWTVERVLPDVVKATDASGPSALAGAARERVEAGDMTTVLASWLRGDGLQPVERFLARAALTAPLTVLDPARVGTACADDPTPRGDRRCPHCGGPPQLSVRVDPSDGLVTGGRELVCVRCGRSWAFSASSCPSCGETAGSKRTIYAESGDGLVVGRPERRPELARSDQALLPHLRVEACLTCQRYVIEVDLGREPRAVPEVDELVAVPLDLHAVEQGQTKLTPNLMGV